MKGLILFFFVCSTTVVLVEGFVTTTTTTTTAAAAPGVLFGLQQQQLQQPRWPTSSSSVRSYHNNHRKQLLRPPLQLTPQKILMQQQSQNVYRGQIMLVMSKLLVSPAKYWDAIHRILAFTFWPEVFLVWATIQAMPIAEWFYKERHTKWIPYRQRLQQRLTQQVVEQLNGGNNTTKTTTTIQKINSGTTTPTMDFTNEAKTTDPATVNNATEEDEEQVKDKWKQAFLQSKTRKVALVLRRVGLLQAILYCQDVVLVFLKLMGFEFVVKYQAQKVAGSTILALWGAYNLSRVKYYYLSNGYFSLSSYKQRQEQRKQEALRRQQLDAKDGGVITPPMGVYSRLTNQVLDVLIYLSAFMTVVDLLGLSMGMTFKSLFGIGSFGTLVLSLASKDVAAEFVGGLMIHSSNFLEEGETVVLQDGTTGEILKIGWLFTYLQKPDDYVVRVPNSQISHQRIAREKRVFQQRSQRLKKRFRSY